MDIVEQLKCVKIGLHYQIAMKRTNGTLAYWIMYPTTWYVISNTITYSIKLYVGNNFMKNDSGTLDLTLPDELSIVDIIEIDNDVGLI